jgi:hypothetical protein
MCKFLSWDCPITNLLAVGLIFMVQLLGGEGLFCH